MCTDFHPPLPRRLCSYWTILALTLIAQIHTASSLQHTGSLTKRMVLGLTPTGKLRIEMPVVPPFVKILRKEFKDMEDKEKDMTTARVPIIYLPKLNTPEHGNLEMGFEYPSGDDLQEYVEYYVMEGGNDTSTITTPTDTTVLEFPGITVPPSNNNMEEITIFETQNDTENPTVILPTQVTLANLEVLLPAQNDTKNPTAILPTQNTLENPDFLLLESNDTENPTVVIPTQSTSQNPEVLIPAKNDTENPKEIFPTQGTSENSELTESTQDTSENPDVMLPTPIDIESIEQEKVENQRSPTDTPNPEFDDQDYEYFPSPDESTDDPSSNSTEAPSSTPENDDGDYQYISEEVQPTPIPAAPEISTPPTETETGGQNQPKSIESLPESPSPSETQSYRIPKLLFDPDVATGTNNQKTDDSYSSNPVNLNSSISFNALEEVTSTPTQAIPTHVEEAKRDSPPVSDVVPLSPVKMLEERKKLTIDVNTDQNKMTFPCQGIPMTPKPTAKNFTPMDGLFVTIVKMAREKTKLINATFTQLASVLLGIPKRKGDSSNFH